MDDLRCPQCGEQNPSGSERCRSCGLSLEPAPGPAANDSIDESSDTPDWLKRIRARKRAEQSTQGGSEAPIDDTSVAKLSSAVVPPDDATIEELPDQPGIGARIYPALASPEAREEDQDFPEEVLPVADEALSGPPAPAAMASGQPDVEELPNTKDEAPGPVPLDGSLILPGLLDQLNLISPVDEQADVPAAGQKSQETAPEGPLSGLRDVLPAEEGIGRIGPPLRYPIRLQVTEQQAAHAALLVEVLQAAGQGRSSSRRIIGGEPALPRIAIALLLLGVLLWTLLSGIPDAPPPPITPAVGAANALVEGLAPGSPVLVAVDYEPALAGEMEAATASLVNHMLERGAYLVLASTNASGPAMAERLMAGTLRVGAAGSQLPLYSNLGFLPGGVAGLQSFAQSPRLAMPYVLDARERDVPAWTSGPLARVQMPSDFSLAVVITDDADRARAWIEQVGPALADSPLVMVVSAQIEPIVRPYYQAYPQQVDGLVGGLAGGAAYEDLNGQPGLAADNWNAFSTGSLVAAGLAVAGGLMNRIVVAFAGRLRREEKRR